MSKWWNPTEQEALEFELKDLFPDSDIPDRILDIFDRLTEDLTGSEYNRGWNDRDDEYESDNEEELEDEYIRGWNDCVKAKKEGDVECLEM